MLPKVANNVRYSGSKLDRGYPLPLQGHWGHLPASFVAGFDSMTVLPNSKTYVTKGISTFGIQISQLAL